MSSDIKLYNYAKLSDGSNKIELGASMGAERSATDPTKVIGRLNLLKSDGTFATVTGDTLGTGGGSSGAVNSVNGKTGDVELKSAEIPLTTDIGSKSNIQDALAYLDAKPTSSGEGPSIHVWEGFISNEGLSLAAGAIVSPSINLSISNGYSTFMSTGYLALIDASVTTTDRIKLDTTKIPSGFILSGVEFLIDIINDTSAILPSNVLEVSSMLNNAILRKKVLYNNNLDLKDGICYHFVHPQFKYDLDQTFGFKLTNIGLIPLMAQQLNILMKLTFVKDMVV